MSISGATDFASTAVLWAGIVGMTVGVIAFTLGAALGIAASVGAPVRTDSAAYIVTAGALVFAVAAVVYVQVGGGELVLGPWHFKREGF